MTATITPISRGRTAAFPRRVPRPRAGEVAAELPAPTDGRHPPTSRPPHRIPPGTLVEARIHGEQLVGRVMPHDTSTIGRLPMVPVKFGEYCRILLPTDLSIVELAEAAD
ncbi:hypothetical protein [Saccharopolyspora sp. 5N708]|uniref:hypothetical protein n=1 Tax=Saccharopolyspora sp. 5N708 TaxID=3457424 RepID=UPI003FD41998